MKKILLQGLLLVVLFFGCWYALNQVDWFGIFKIEKLSKTTEEKLGDLFWEMYSHSEREIHNKEIIGAVDSLLMKICEANDIDRSELKLHIFRKDEINAFALPNKHLVIFSGLISASGNESELIGVIGHEVAHIQLDHVMKRLIKEVGLSVLITMTTGNGNGEIIKETAKMLSSMAYDRTLETEADIKSVDYMIAAHINPEPFAEFLYKLSNEESTVAEYLAWISTHPDSKERAEYIIEYSRGRTGVHEQVLSTGTWNNLKTYAHNLKED